jgi:hypothetical protein
MYIEHNILYVRYEKNKFMTSFFQVNRYEYLRCPIWSMAQKKIVSHEFNVIKGLKSANNSHRIVMCSL